MKLGLEKVGITITRYPDLTRYEKMYDNFDEGHDITHMLTVRIAAIALAKKYLREGITLAYIAATLHDIGLSKGRDNHEVHGSEMIKKDKYLKTILTKLEIEEIAKAVKQHRASTGNPTTVLAKIISDADRTPISISCAIYRSISYNITTSPGETLRFYIETAAIHLSKKYGKNNYGRRVYYSETELALSNVFDVIISSYEKGGCAAVWKLVNTDHKSKIHELLK